MPTYEYHCQKCGKSFDYFQKMSDDALTECPKEACQAKRWGKGQVSRGIGAGAGLIFKGSGFYITDYRSEGYKAAAKKDSAPSSSDSGSTSKTSSSDSKPAKASSKSASKKSS